MIMALRSVIIMSRKQGLPLRHKRRKKEEDVHRRGAGNAEKREGIFIFSPKRAKK